MTKLQRFVLTCVLGIMLAAGLTLLAGCSAEDRAEMRREAELRDQQCGHLLSRYVTFDGARGWTGSYAYSNGNRPYLTFYPEDMPYGESRFYVYAACDAVTPINKPRGGVE